MILPATLLLVPGLVPGLRPDPLAAVRGAVAAALAGLTAGGRVPLVLAHGPALRHGRMRPSLAGSGIGDRWLPAPSTGPAPSTRSGHRAGEGRLWADTDRPAAGTGASVALLALADVLGARASDVDALEVPPHWTGLDAGPADLLRRADCLVVAGGGVPGGLDTGPDALTDGVRSALRIAGADAWATDVQVFEQAHDHLPPEYRVTTLS